MRFSVLDAVGAVVDLPLVVGAQVLSVDVRGTCGREDDSAARLLVGVHAADVDDALLVAAAWGLSYAPERRLELARADRPGTVHHFWTGHVPTPGAPLEVEVVALAPIGEPLPAGILEPPVLAGGVR